jgi:hypothetical protein
MIKRLVVLVVLLALTALCDVGHSASMCDGIDMSEETFVDDPDGVEEAVGASVELSCAYYDNARFFFWEFHPRVGQRLTIRRSDDYP